MAIGDSKPFQPLKMQSAWHAASAGLGPELQRAAEEGARRQLLA